MPVQEAPKPEYEPSPFQKKYAEKLEVYEAAHNLSVVTFAKLAGKSRDQVNRDIKAKRLLTLSFGNRGQRIPDWQLDPLGHKLTQAILDHAPEVDEWAVYRALSEPHEGFKGRTPIEAVTSGNLSKISKILCDELGQR